MCLFDDKNKIKPDWEKLGYREDSGEEIRRECHSCFEWYTTTNRWSKRCPGCKKIDAPKRKRIVNTNLEKPF